MDWMNTTLWEETGHQTVDKKEMKEIKTDILGLPEQSVWYFLKVLLLWNKTLFFWSMFLFFLAKSTVISSCSFSCQCWWGPAFDHQEWINSGDMSLEDVGSTTSLGAESVQSEYCNGHSLSQGQDQDPDNKSQGQDGIVLDRIASLSLDMFDPSDFTGRFSKIQSRSRKRTRIFLGRCRQTCDFLKIYYHYSEHDMTEQGECSYVRSLWYATVWLCNNPAFSQNANLSWPEGFLRLEMVEGLVEHPAEIMISISPTRMWAVFYNPAWDLKSFSSLTTYLDPLCLPMCALTLL